MRNSERHVLLLMAAMICSPLFAEDTLPLKQPTREAVIDAVKRGLSLLEKAAKNYPEHRDCFACHHQTVPLAAMREVRRIGLTIDEPLFDDTVKFVRSYFSRHTDEMKQGRGIPGRAFMVGYGAWSFELADVELPDDLRAAMAQYVIQRQEPDGRWRPASIRPPSEQSEVMNTVLALRVLRPKLSARPFASDAEWFVTAEATEQRALQWLNEAPLKWQEDFVARLWSLHWFGDDNNQRSELVRKIVERQQSDGGWAAEDNLKSEAYSTGLTLFALLDTGESPTSAAITRGLAHLLNTQHADGSWLVETRAKPVQVFFDNGDPHGKNQFISISATGWSIAALARSLHLKPQQTQASGAASARLVNAVKDFPPKNTSPKRQRVRARVTPQNPLAGASGLYSRRLTPPRSTGSLTAGDSGQ